MVEGNVFAPPKASLVPTTGRGCAREGQDVVIETGVDLPARCIICNAPAAQPVKSVKIYWHSPWVYLLIFINLFVYILFAIIVRKSREVSPGLCEVHAAKRMRLIIALLGAAALLAIGGIALFNVGQGTAGTFSLALALLPLFGTAFAARKIYAKKITKKYARMQGTVSRIVRVMLARWR